MSITKLSLTLMCGMVVLAFSPAGAATLKTDNFAYPDGNLVGNGDWANHSGTGSFIQVVSEEVVLQHGGGSREDANTGFTAQTTGVLTADFDITVLAEQTIGTNGTDFEYFAHFFTDGDFNFRSRLDVVAPTTGGDYTLGISSGSSTAEANLPTDFSFGSVVPVSISFDLNSGIGSLTAGGNTVSGIDTFLSESLDRFALRQSTSSENEMITVDNLVISQVPEPATFLLVLAGLMVIAAVRRR